MSGLLIEGHPFGTEMNGVVHLARRRLVVQLLAFSVAFQVDVNLTLGGHHSGLRIIFKVIAVDLVKAILFAPVDDDVHIVQFGMAALFELRRLGGVNGDRASGRLRSWRA